MAAEGTGWAKAGPECGEEKPQAAENGRMQGGVGRCRDKRRDESFEQP